AFAGLVLLGFVLLRKSAQTVYRVPPVGSIEFEIDMNSVMRYLFGGMHLRPLGQPVVPFGPVGRPVTRSPTFPGAVQLAGLLQTTVAPHFTNRVWPLAVPVLLFPNVTKTAPPAPTVAWDPWSLLQGPPQSGTLEPLIAIRDDQVAPPLVDW